MRQRDCESGIPLEYLRDLYNAYEHFIADISRVIPVIKVDYSRFRTAEEMAKMIKIEYSQIANVRHVHFDRLTPPLIPHILSSTSTSHSETEENLIQETENQQSEQKEE